MLLPILAGSFFKLSKALCTMPLFFFLCIVHVFCRVFLYTTMFGFTLDPHQERLRLHYSFSASGHCVKESNYSPLVGSRPKVTNSHQSGCLCVSGDTAHGIDGLSENLRHRRPRIDPHPKPRLGSADPSESDSKLPCGVGDGKSAILSNSITSERNTLKSSLLSRTLQPWRSLSPEAVVVSGCQQVAVGRHTGSSPLLAPSPEIVRQEVECLWADFLIRVKQLLFSTIMCAFFAGFLPMHVIRVSMHLKWDLFFFFFLYL